MISVVTSLYCNCSRKNSAISCWRMLVVQLPRSTVCCFAKQYCKRHIRSRLTFMGMTLKCMNKEASEEYVDLHWSVMVNGD